MVTTPGRVATLVVAVVVAACTQDTTPPPPTTTTVPPTTIGIDITSAGPAAFTVGEGVDGAAAERLETELEELRHTAETLRGLRFLDPPRVALLTDPAFAERMGDAGVGPAPSFEAETTILRLMGLLGPGQSIDALFEGLDRSEGSTPAFYDPATAEVVVAASTELDPRTRSEIVRELVRALVDVYHRYSLRIPELLAAGQRDEAEALAALVEADATYFQLVYIQDLPDEDRTRVAASRPVRASALPAAVNVLWSFPYERGIPFIEAVLEQGGLAELDLAYGSERLTTEHLRHPGRYLAAEEVRQVAPVTATLPGYTTDVAGTWGSAGLEALLVDALSPGMLTQTVDGWGGDAFALYSAAGGSAFVYAFRGDTVTDATEVAQAFLDHAGGVMGMRDPQSALGGVEFVGTVDAADPEAEGPYMFVDRDGEGLLVVVSDDPASGRTLRDTLPVP